MLIALDHFYNIVGVNPWDNEQVLIDDLRESGHTPRDYLIFKVKAEVL